MANVNSNPAQARTGGPSIASTGPQDQTNQPDSQKGNEANAIGQKEKGPQPPNAGPTDGGKQPTDPVQND
ncbi:hypothetical protein [Sphingomicrobium nitratireducens]|uniref:hypothetical protein n=1 Tax=Sphingomicrobium nitratireducens TaxID=2964666 RepID=UPI00223F5B1B|nr:hypothetical protein [Sphingomicrobium nitratireducens]